MRDAKTEATEQAAGVKGLSPDLVKGDLLGWALPMYG